jgi:Kef-type K+ transport system membrane component KefB
MNARGLTELIVLNVGLETGVIDRRLFSLLALMAVVTTVATGPLLGWIRPDVELREFGAR